uniref:Uncharacterized protein n=1 Tax=Ditylenchus dipsaci TaxID=166011 RepID=A0A915DWN9_9BILA
MFKVVEVKYEPLSNKWLWECLTKTGSNRPISPSPILLDYMHLMHEDTALSFLHYNFLCVLGSGDIKYIETSTRIAQNHMLRFDVSQRKWSVTDLFPDPEHGYPPAGTTKFICSRTAACITLEDLPVIRSTKN